MEDGLRGIGDFLIRTQSIGVLILVLVEDGLRAKNK